MIIKIISIIFLFSCSFLSSGTNLDSAREGVLSQTPAIESSLTSDSSTSQPLKPEVGKHVMANMNASSMIMSLFMVLALIVVCAVVIKRFNLTPQSVKQLKLIASLPLGAKDRVVVVQVGEQQYLLGVGSQQVSLLDKLETPLTEAELNSAVMPQSVLSFLSNKQ